MAENVIRKSSTMDSTENLTKMKTSRNLREDKSVATLISTPQKMSRFW